MAYTEQQFTDLADAANLALAAGKRGLAERLDVMARKANAALANQSAQSLIGSEMFKPRAIRWQAVPSVLRAATGDSGNG